jgi:hypothetical protein
VLNFRKGSRPPDFYAGPIRRRLLGLVFGLGLVAFLISKARDPTWWQWIDGEAEARSAAGKADHLPPINTVVPRKHQGEGVPGAFSLPSPPGPPPARDRSYVPGVRRDFLAVVRDDDVFRGREHDAFFHLLGLLDKTDDRALAKASLGPITFAQLFRQSSTYRGQVVTIRGQARQVYAPDVPRNKYGIERYHQVWIQPDDNPTDPMVAYVLELPPGFPAETTVREPVELTGFFYKRWAYAAQDNIRTTPLLLARSFRWGPAASPTQEHDLTVWIGATLGTVMVGLLALMLVSAWGQRSMARERLAPTPAAEERTLELLRTAEAGRCPGDGGHRTHRRQRPGREAPRQRHGSVMSRRLILPDWPLSWAGPTVSASRAQPSLRTAAAVAALVILLSGAVLPGVILYAQDAVEPPALAPAPAEAAAPPVPISSPQELLELRGVEPSHYRMLVDGRPVDMNEQEALLRFLYAINKIDLGDVERWGQTTFSLTRQAAQPNDGRGGFFRVAGRVTGVAIERPLPEVVDRFEMDHYYRCELRLEGGGTAWVYAVDIPDKWAIDQPMDERASLDGCFLKWRVNDPGPAEPVFAAQRVAWHPPTILGDLEMDVGLFDDVKNREAILARERECFFQLLAAAGRAGINELARRTQDGPPRPPSPPVKRSRLKQLVDSAQTEPPHDYSVVPLFNDPDKQHGELVALTGTTRSVREVLISVSDPDIVKRFGFDRYYQVELITDDSQGNPLVFCVRELPAGFPQGADVRELVRIPGFFFKTWSYRQQRLDDAQPVRRQLAPMLVGRAPLWLRPPESPYLKVVSICLFFLAVAGAGWAAWRLSRGDRRFRERVIAKKFEPDSKQSLDELGLEVDSGPDFRGMG